MLVVAMMVTLGMAAQPTYASGPVGYPCASQSISPVLIDSADDVFGGTWTSYFYSTVPYTYSDVAFTGKVTIGIGANEFSIPDAGGVINSLTISPGGLFASYSILAGGVGSTWFTAYIYGVAGYLTISYTTAPQVVTSLAVPLEAQMYNGPLSPLVYSGYVFVC